MRLSLLIAALLISASAASAQATGLMNGWREGSVTIYGWLPGITGSQQLPDGRPIVDLDGASVLDALDLAFFGAGEIRKDRVGLLFDIEYADLSQDGTADRTFVPGADAPSASVGTTLLMSTGVVAYRFFEQENNVADVYGGIRAFDVEADFGVEVPSIGFDFSSDASAQWVDVLVGMRGHADLGRRFGVTGLADVGGFGIGESSDLTWQVTGTLDYGFSESFVGRLGYRYMSIDYQSTGLSMDIDMYGPLIGVTYTF